MKIVITSPGDNSVGIPDGIIDVNFMGIQEKSIDADELGEIIKKLEELGELFFCEKVIVQTEQQLIDEEDCLRLIETI